MNRKWYARNIERARVMNAVSERKRSAQKRGAFVEDIDRTVVFVRSLGICGICKEYVQNHHEWHVDHVVPLSLGGEHAYRNVQLAHASCNLSKGAKMLTGAGG